MSKILQHTGLNDRYYEQDGKFYPSVTYILQWAKTSPFLKDWYKAHGFESDKIFETRSQVGSFVHDAIEQMAKLGAVYTEEDINKAMTTAGLGGFYTDQKESLFVKRCFLGIMNFFEDSKAQIVSSEHTVIASDYAGTVDLILTFPGSSDKWQVDIKTSKSIFDTHKYQIEAYRRATGCIRCGILQLGNTTKKRYTLSPTKEMDHDKHWAYFQAIKTLFYLDNPDPKPSEEVFPKEFKLPTNPL